MNQNEEKDMPVIPENSEPTTPPVTPLTEEKNIESVEQEKLENQVNQELVKEEQTQVQPLSNENQTVVNETTTSNVVSNEAIKDAPTNNPQEPNSNLNNSNNKGPSTFGKIMTVLLFIFLFAFVYFLGDITDYLNQRKLDKQMAELDSGKLMCTSTKQTDTLDIKVSATFTFENKKINQLTYITTSTGDKLEDKKELESLKEQCDILKEEIKDYDGISIVCSLNNGINSVKQIFNYASINIKEVSAAYSEAGGVYPQFKYKDAINSVESKMNSSGYKCEKVSS